MDNAVLTAVIGFVFGTLGGGVMNYWLRRREDRARVGDAERLAGYTRLVTSLDGFFDGTGDAKRDFFAELRKAHLYASMDVLRACRALVDACVDVHTNRSDRLPPEQGETLVVNILQAMRRDLGFADEPLEGNIFRHYSLVSSGRQRR